MAQAIDGSATLTISGTEAAINTALDGLQYQGSQDYNGSDTLTVTTGSDAAVEANLARSLRVLERFAGRRNERTTLMEQPTGIRR